jgi:hypothetical protein
MLRERMVELVRDAAAVVWAVRQKLNGAKSEYDMQNGMQSSILGGTLSKKPQRQTTLSASKSVCHDRQYFASYIDLWMRHVALERSSRKAQVRQGEIFQTEMRILRAKLKSRPNVNTKLKRRLALPYMDALSV